MYFGSRMMAQDIPAIPMVDESLISTTVDATMAPGRVEPTLSTTHNPSFAVPPPPESRPHEHPSKELHDQHIQQTLNGDDRFSQSDHRSNDGSQASNATTNSDQVFTPTSSERELPNGSSQESQLLQLSALAAAQQRMNTDPSDAVFTGRKRMADGEVKDINISPKRGRGHSRNPSAVSMASTSASTVIDMTSDLKARLTYAMLKVNNGWQSRSLDEVEGLASQAASPASTSSTARRVYEPSISPQMTSIPEMQVRLADEPPSQRRKSNSPPNQLSNIPGLAPPASIKPSAGNPRRTNTPHYTRTLVGRAYSASPLGSVQPQHRAISDLYSPHQNVREKDAIESLLFMSSPSNSANMKHTYSPVASPGPNSQPTPRTAARHALPSGPRKALPNQRAQPAAKRVDFHDALSYSPRSPMDLDSPRSLHGTPRRKTIGTLMRPPTIVSERGLGSGSRMRELTDKDIDKMLDEAVAAVSGARGDSDGLDDDMIEIPARVVT